MNLMTLFPAWRRQPSQGRDGMALTSIKKTLMVGVRMIQHLGFAASTRFYGIKTKKTESKTRLRGLSLFLSSGLFKKTSTCLTDKYVKAQLC